jgi:hypothetical protein
MIWLNVWGSILQALEACAHAQLSWLILRVTCKTLEIREGTEQCPGSTGRAKTWASREEEWKKSLHLEVTQPRK